MDDDHNRAYNMGIVAIQFHLINTQTDAFVSVRNARLSLGIARSRLLVSFAVKHDGDGSHPTRTHTRTHTWQSHQTVSNVKNYCPPAVNTTQLSAMSQTHRPACLAIHNTLIVNTYIAAVAVNIL